MIKRLWKMMTTPRVRTYSIHTQVLQGSGLSSRFNAMLIDGIKKELDAWKAANYAFEQIGDRGLAVIVYDDCGNRRAVFSPYATFKTSDIIAK